MPKLDIHKIRKDEIVQVASALVAKKGWQNTKLTDIAKEADVSLGVITYHFSSKDEIIRTVMEKYVGDNLAEHFHALDEYEDPVERMKNHVRATLNVSRQHPDIYHLLFDYWAKISWNEEIRKMNSQFYDFARDWTADCVRAGIDSGVFKEVDPRNAATLINALILGIQMQHTFDEGAFDFDRVAEMAERTILDYLLI